MRVHLAIDNCFAKKRWCEPAEWVPLVADLGVRYVEASADNEIDPLFSCPGHIADWRAETTRLLDRHGLRIVTCYSGHGTYSTLGLGHHDERVRRHIQEDWVQRMLDLAGSLNAMLGFFAHGFSEKVLRDRNLYREFYDRLVISLRELSEYAESRGVPALSIEQMYSPNQVPWTLAGAEEFLRRVNDKPGGCPVYITLDTGHQSGQWRFVLPTEEQLGRFADEVRAGGPGSLYLGPREHADGFRDKVLAGMPLDELKGEVDRFTRDYDHLFCRAEDGETYRWIETYGCYSPIVHLQQTDGRHSDHWCFTAENNARGIITAPKVLNAIARSFRSPEPAGYPPRVSDIYLVVEPFLPTACNSRLWLEDVAESVAYWRRHVPEDGVTIEELVAE